MLFRSVNSSCKAFVIKKTGRVRKLTRPAVDIGFVDGFSQRSLLTDDYLGDLVALTTDEKTVFGVLDTDALKVEIFGRSVIVCADF